MPNPDKYRPWFNPIRNKIRKHQPLSLIMEASRVLHEVKEFPLDKVAAYTPWTVLQIIKWTVLYGEEIEYGLKPAKRQTIHDLINLVRELEGNVIADFSDIHSFLRAMSHQQFWLQRGPDQSFYGRQIQTMFNLDRKGRVQQRFKTISGIDLSDFLELAMITSSHFLARDSLGFKRSYFHNVRSSYPDSVVDQFLRLLSKKPADLRAFLSKQDERVRAFELRMYEQTPLKYFPLLCLGDEFLCYSPAVLQVALSTFVYDLLKAADPGGFSGEFGGIFEEYVRLGLDEAAIKYLTESEVQKLVGKQIKAVDFLLPFEDANVFVESKAIELPPYAAVAADRKVLDKALRDSIVKAIQQALSAADHLSKVSGHPAAGDKRSYLLVVTYKSLYIGKGTDFIRGDVLQELTQFCASNGIRPDLIKHSRIHFLSASEYEILISMISEGVHLPKFLDEVEATNSNPSTEKFDFGQHFSPTNFPKFVREPYEELTKRVLQKLGKKP